MTDKEMTELALAQGWQVEPVSLYDEEGVEGWLWTSPGGSEEIVTAMSSEYPIVPLTLYNKIIQGEI